MLKDGELKSEEFMNDAILAYQGMVLRVALNQTRNMADALSCSRVSVRVRLHRARERLRGLLTEDSKASGEEATTLILEPEEST